MEIAPSELIKSFKKLVESKIEELKPSRIFIDSIEALFLAIESNYKLRTLIDDVFGVFRKHEVTSVITVGAMYGLDERSTTSDSWRVGRSLLARPCTFIISDREGAHHTEVRVLNSERGRWAAPYTLVD